MYPMTLQCLVVGRWFSKKLSDMGEVYTCESSTRFSMYYVVALSRFLCQVVVFFITFVVCHQLKANEQSLTLQLFVFFDKGSYKAMFEAQLLDGHTSTLELVFKMVGKTSNMSLRNSLSNCLCCTSSPADKKYGSTLPTN